MVQRIILYFLSEKREGLAFERLKFTSSLKKGYETSRLEMDRWKILHSAKDLGMSIADYVEM